MTEVKTSEDVIMELKAEIEALKCAIAEQQEKAEAKRIIDFISGTTYALGGEIKKVGRNVFLCAPSNVNVAYTQEQKTVSTEMPWLK